MREINIAVNKEVIKKDSKNAGVRGDSASTKLYITFGEEWRAYSKRIRWLNAMGENPVAVLLYNDVEELVSGRDPLSFESRIPAEAMTAEGWCSFTIEGFKASAPTAITFTTTEYLWVADTDRDYLPEDVTPTQAQQLQAMIEGVTENTAAIVAEAKKELNDTQRDISVWEEWNPEKEYVPLNKVVRFGSSYICLKTNTGVNPGGDADNNYWLLIAAKGERGQTGLQGRDGKQGPRGINGVAVETSGVVAFNVDENGNLWVSYADEKPPDYFIGTDGCLYVRVTDDGELGYGEYEGVYEVTPKFEETVLETEGDLMMSNLTIKGIPISEVSNDAGGKTVIIG